MRASPNLKIALFLMFIAGVLFSAYPPGLVSYYPFDSNASDVVGTNHGTVSGATLNTTGGRVGGGYYFNGVNNYISLSDAGALSTLANGNFTLSVWAKVTDKSATRNFLRRDNYIDEGAEARRAIALSVITGTGYSSFGFHVNGVDGGPARGSVNRADGIWHHFVGTYNTVTKNVSLFFDGQLESSAISSISASFNTARQPWVIGTVSPVYVGEMMYGTIDEVAIFNRTLSPSEISQMYNNSKDGASNYFNSPSSPPTISFVSPTPEDSATITSNSTKINVSVNMNVSACSLYVYYGGLDSVLGDGSDGVISVSSANTVINSYSYLAGNETAEDNSILVNNPSAFLPEDEILIIQMQNYSSGIAGQYEFARISAINGNLLSLSKPLNKSYYSGSFNSTTATATQAVRVPQYTNLIVNSGASIIPKAWDGYTGGIVIFRAFGNVTVAGSIDASNRGFRSGTGTYPAGTFSDPGESTKGLGSSSVNNNLGGGGGSYGGVYGVSYSSGAGGGGYGSSGGAGLKESAPVNGGSGGEAYGDAPLSQIFFGSGGGRGYGTSPALYNGGGIIYISASSINNSGSITASSTGGEVISGGGGGAGGGAGGSIYLTASKIILLSSPTATGGAGAVINDPNGNGGNGGVGRIKMDYGSLSGTTNPIHYSGNYSGAFAESQMSVHNSDSLTWADYTLNGLSKGAYNYYVNCTNFQAGSNITETRTFIVSVPNVTINSPASGAILTFLLVTLNWTPANFISNPTCNVTRNETTIFSGTCTNNTACTITNATQDGFYKWNVTCYIGTNSVTSETRNYTVNALDITPPTAALFSPSSGNITPSLSISFSCNATDTIQLSNITLNIWNSSNSLVYSITSSVSGTSNNSSWDYTFSQRGNFKWNCLAYDNSSNSAYASSNATLTIQKPTAISILIPANGSGISRGKDNAEDMLARVSDSMAILTRITDNESGQGVPGINCSLAIDGVFKSNSTTNSTGYCTFSYNKASDSFGIHSISINQSNIPSDYYTPNPGILLSFSLDNWSMTLVAANYRSPLFYYVDDVASVLINITKNGAPANVTSMSVLMVNQIGQVLKTLSTVNIIQIGTGEYKAEDTIPQTSLIGWKVVAMSDFSGQDSNATSSLHADMLINTPPAAELNMSMVGSDNQPLANSTITLYRIGELGKYQIFNQTMNSSSQSVQKSIVQNDNEYELVITTPQNQSISLLGIILSTASSNFVTQQANFTGAKPNQTRYVGTVLASNATGFSVSTLIFVKTFEPTSICSCQNWSFANSNCGGVWVCNSTSAYSYAFNSTHFWFNVTHFTGYALGQSENENLTIWDETDSGMQYGNQMKYINQNIRFFTNYSNSTSEPITGANCSIWFSDSGWNAMNWNSTNLYEYTRNFNTGGTFNWNVTCNKSGQTTLVANDTVNVNSTILVVLNSPADALIQRSSIVLFNWTPYGFPGDPSCNVTRNGTLIHISSCTNNELCVYSNTTANGYYIWNITCNSGATTRESSTRSLTVNTIYRSSSAEGILNMNITEISSISLPQNTISFGTVEITQTYDSYPSKFFVIKNDGNTIVDVEVNATNPFLGSNCTSLPCSAYQVKVGANETTPYPICSANPSKINYTNMYGSSSSLLINDLNFVDNDDSANIYIKYVVPNDEPPGSKSSTVTFWAKSAGSYSCN